MKKILAAVIAFFAILACNAQNISTIVANDNAKCPIPMAQGITISSITLTPEKDAIVYDVAVDESVSFDKLKEQSEMLHDVKATELSTASEPTAQALRRACIAANVAIRYVFNSGDDSFSFTITPAEMK